jgi:hypothetical protein
MWLGLQNRSGAVQFELSKPLRKFLLGCGKTLAKEIHENIGEYRSRIGT